MSTVPQAAAFVGAVPVVAPTITEPTAKRWTRQEYHRLGEQGWFEGQRVELVDGEIILLSPQSPEHAVAAELVRHVLHVAFGEQVHIRSQSPLVKGNDSEAQPDICVVRGAIRDYAREHPITALLVVEVSRTSLEYDLSTKHCLYASMLIPDYWVLDVDRRRLIVHRNPVVDPTAPFGYRYDAISTLGETETIAPLEKPEASIRIADMLP